MTPDRQTHCGGSDSDDGPAAESLAAAATPPARAGGGPDSAGGIARHMMRLIRGKIIMASSGVPAGLAAGSESRSGRDPPARAASLSQCQSP